MSIERGFIEVKIEGSVNGRKLTPEDVDIDDIQELLADIETFIYLERTDKKNRELISYRIEDGSAKHKLNLAVTGVILFNGLTKEIENKKSLNFLETKRAEVIERFQRKAKDNSYTITFSNSYNTETKLVITNQTNFVRDVPEFIETEVYLYGEIYEEGGITEPNIHINTEEYGKLTISTTKEQISTDKNILYKIIGVRAFGKQNLSDGKLMDLKLVDFIPYSPSNDEGWLDKAISRASNIWKGVDVDRYMKEIRGEA